MAALTAALAPAQSPSSLAGEMEVSPELFEDQRATAEATRQLLVEAQADLEATVRSLSNAQAQVDAEKRKAASALEAHQVCVGVRAFVRMQVSICVCLQEEVRTLQGICAMAQKETSDIRNRHEQAMHQLREAHARVHQLTQECSRLTDWNNSLKYRQQQHSRGGVASGSSPSPLGMMEPEAVRPKPATGPVTGFRLPRTKDAVFPVTEAEDALCAHTKRKHSCEACAIGASVTNLSFGIIPPELVPVVKESPLSAWKANLHGPITASSGALTRPPSVGKPRSAPNSPFSTRVGSTTPARPGDNMVDESFRSSATGILGIEMIAPSPTDTNTSFVQWSLNGLK